MKSIVIVIALLLLGQRGAMAGRLKPAPGTVKLCVFVNGKATKAIQPFDAACQGACQKVAQDICSDPNVKEEGIAEGSLVSATSWQSAVVTSLGQLAADRAKAEVATWFEDLVRDKLCDLKTGKELWFPATCKLLKDDLGTGQQLLSPLVVQAVERDVPSFIAGLTNTIAAGADPRVRPVLTALPALVLFGAKLADGYSPLELLAKAGADPRVQKTCRDRAKPEEVTGPCLVVFAGITIDYYGPLIANGVKTLGEVQKFAVKLLADGGYRCAVYKAFSGEDKPCPDASASLGNVPLLLQKLVSATVITTEAKIHQLFGVVRDAADVNAYLTDLVSEHSVPTGVQLAHTLDLLDEMWKDVGTFVWDGGGPTSFTLFHHAFAAGSALGRKQYRELVLELVALATESKIKLPEWATRLMPLVVDLAEAEDAGGVSAALARAAAPVGSWKLKRQRRLWSITALVGAAGGYEFPVRDRLDAQATNSGPAGGGIAPIGLEISRPLGSSSIGLLLSVIDVGQITWSRLRETRRSATEAGTKSLPSAELSQVFSPGGYLVFSAGKSPFAFGVGASFAPDLRAFTYDVSGSPVERDVSVWRIGLFVAVDVTLFPL